ncbi:MAG: DUF1353 domain-containing protein [Candidatus Accumulibacter sp.]|jgi:hypothetical protein|uniref:DUF1353 domain-containing protein n=1 Tax=Accumulibacter sp. TaxID=2053492 RepID=UPI001AC95FE7|nr:DUF1353 domain-containing protein [Accumulibacter sp.]MBN8439518.1 DUF1353 domain-containing protein [Accumulibacter sp.]
MKPLLICSRLFQTITVALVLSGCAATTPMKAEFKKAPVVTPFSDNYWLLLEDLTFESVRESDSRYFKITVPAGFVTDLASIPVPLNVIYDKSGRYSSAGILHDYLYWTQFCDREKSDRLIKEGLKATGSSYITRNTIKYGVLWFGWVAWNSNEKDKIKGEDRFVPETMRRFPSHTRWENYKTEIDRSIKSPWQLPEARTEVQAGCDLFVDEES